MDEFKSLINYFKEGLVQRELPLETEVCWWLLVSCLDFLMTYLLLIHPETAYIESNPIAVRFFHDWGFKGLLGFKLFMAIFVILICQIIARSKVEIARRVLQFGILIVGGVVLYSMLLYARGGASLDAGTGLSMF